MSAITMFRCCFEAQPTEPTTKRRQIDRTMIGLPTNFQHTAHIGSSDIDGSGGQTECTVMQTKGGYNENEIHSHLNLIDLPKLS